MDIDISAILADIAAKKKFRERSAMLQSLWAIFIEFNFKVPILNFALLLLSLFLLMNMMLYLE